MPLELSYRSTFIVAADSEDAAQGFPLRRALTAPPPRPGCMSHLGEDVPSEELTVARCRDYLKGLMEECGLARGNVEHGASKRMPNGSKNSNDAASDAPKNTWEQISIGSLGHPIQDHVCEEFTQVAAQFLFHA